MSKIYGGLKIRLIFFWYSFGKLLLGTSRWAVVWLIKMKGDGALPLGLGGLTGLSPLQHLRLH
jgi:hypothetical protein